MTQSSIDPNVTIFTGGTSSTFVTITQVVTHCRSMEYVVTFFSTLEKVLVREKDGALLLRYSNTSIQSYICLQPSSYTM